ncbi:MAG TPA: YeeE/YedE thiosulfate transporter family protein [Symbiobacteriaceae bacterium]|nr:YeeE/YedE thiosulfate transporter family protein [Symbiobacteriaceae bacterium]
MNGFRRLIIPAVIVLVFTITLSLLATAPAHADCGADTSTCKACHEGEQQKSVNASGLWHTQHAFGDFCAGCHAGDKTIKEKDASHAGMRADVLGDPKAACEACHAGDYEAKAEAYKEKPAVAAAPDSGPKYPPPGSRNMLFIILNLVTLGGLGLLIWAFEKGPLAGKKLPKPASMEGGSAQPVNPLARASWSPYWAGAGLGLVAILALWLAEQPLGSSGAYITLDSLLLKASGSSLSESVYFKMVSPPKLSWQVMLVAGVVLGALVSSLWSGDFRLESAPDRWLQVFGNRKWVRWITIFFGAVILEFGASIAGGCTSGLAIAGSLQLAGAGFLFIGGLFVTGIITTRLLYGRKY